MTRKSTTFLDSGRSAGTTAERHRLLRKKERRALLDVLHEDPPPMDLSVAAETVAEHLHGRRPDPESRHSLMIELHHVHIPMLAEAGVVEYDTEDNRITEFQPLVSQS